MKKSRNKLEIERRENSNFQKNAKNKNDTIVELTKAALFTALLCILAPHTLYLPFSPVGITFGSFLLYVTGMLLGSRLGCISVLLYLGLGFLGLPVFSGYTAGAGVLFGPTGGFLIGYLPCVWTVGFVMDKVTVIRKGELRFLAGIITGTGILYLCGVLWFVFVYAEEVSFWQAVTTCVVPFLPFDGIKTVFAIVLYKPIRRMMHRM